LRRSACSNSVNTNHQLRWIHAGGAGRASAMRAAITVPAQISPWRRIEAALATSQTRSAGALHSRVALLEPRRPRARLPRCRHQAANECVGAAASSRGPPRARRRRRQRAPCRQRPARAAAARPPAVLPLRHRVHLARTGGKNRLGKWSGQRRAERRRQTRPGAGAAPIDRIDSRAYGRALPPPAGRPLRQDCAL
jgi:hypothetical protein